MTTGPSFFAGASGGPPPGPTRSVYLDDYSPLPIWCGGLSRLVQSYPPSAALIRVRRSSDNAESDIYGYGDYLDEAQLLAFVGSGDGFVRAVYEQSGTVNHLVEPTTTRQPKIVAAGVYLGTMLFDGSNDELYTTSTLAISNRKAAVYAKLKKAISGTQVVFEFSDNYNTFVGSFVMYDDAGLRSAGYNRSAINTQVRYDYNTSFAVTDTLSLLLDQDAAGADRVKYYWDGTLRTASGSFDAGSGSPTDFGTRVFHLGSRNGGTLAAAMEAECLAIYAGDTTSARGDIEAVIGVVAP